MGRLGLAFRCFFGLLFGRRLPEQAHGYLPDRLREGALPPAPKEVPDASGEVSEGRQLPVESRKIPSSENIATHHQDGALALLSLLQREGRLIDFLHESLDDYSDEDIGAAARDVHRGCKKVVDEYVSWEAMMPGEEDEPVTVAKGFDPMEVRLIGEVTGEPPFRGVLRHRGLRATSVSFPSLTPGMDRTIIAPAEVELS